MPSVSRQKEEVASFREDMQRLRALVESKRPSFHWPEANVRPWESASHFCPWTWEELPFASPCFPFSNPKETLKCELGRSHKVGAWLEGAQGP